MSKDKNEIREIVREQQTAEDRNPGTEAGTGAEERTGGGKMEGKKTKGSIVGTKRLLALILALCLVFMAAGGVKLLDIYSAADVLNIRWEDWLEKRSYADSDTLALQARDDLSALLRYVKLKQALEETDGTLDLDRPVLAAVLEDDAIGIYTMRDMLEMGEEMGVYVYEGMTDWETGYAIDREDTVEIQGILWSLFDYETNTLNRDTGSFSYMEPEPWDLRILQIEEVIDEAEEGLVSYTTAAGEPITLEEYCVRFLSDYLQPYYIWKGQYSAEETNLHWMLRLERDQESITYGDPAALQGNVTEEQLDAIYRYDSQTKALTSTFSDQIDMISFGDIKSSLLFEYDQYTFWMGLQTEALEQEWDVYGQTAARYTQYRKTALASAVFIGASLLVFAVVLIWLTVLSGRQDGKKEIRLNAYDRLPTEIGLTGVCCLLWLAGWDVYIGGNMMEEMYRYDSPLYNIGFLVCLGFLVILCCLLLWLGWYGLVRRCKAHTIWRNSLARYLLVWMVGLIRRICRRIGSLIRRGAELFYKAGDRWWKTLGLFAVYLLVNFCLMLLLFDARDAFLPLLALLAWNGGTACLMLRKTAQRRQVQNGIDRIASGDIDYQLPLEGLTGDSYEMAAAVNSIRDGLKNAVEEKVKNERMRTELITNVSHDIKTPLTSIINYVDLLKRQNIDDPKVQEYLNILEKKAERLRILTEDLVEASKASSGALKLKAEEIDFVELVNQTNGEFADRFSRCNLKLICTMPDHPVYILADGRYVWRILENLYRNVEKYALSGTRVYVEVTQKGNRICFVIKNISATELNIRAEELTERFIRGDASRTTEGSGLGLSIARDLTRLMNGTFQIYLDGDLFRVTVSFLIHE